MDKESAVPSSVKLRVIQDAENPMVEDISKRGSLTDLVSTIVNTRRVHTDRLHVAILGSIVGKETTLYGNRYHKNHGVYRYSLKGKVSFVSV